MTAILAFDSTVKSNAELIRRAAHLGYLHNDMMVFDATFGLGNFWQRRVPDHLVGADINPEKARDMKLSPAVLRITDLIGYNEWPL